MRVNRNQKMIVTLVGMMVLVGLYQNCGGGKSNGLQFGSDGQPITIAQGAVTGTSTPPPAASPGASPAAPTIQCDAVVEFINKNVSTNVYAMFTFSWLGYKSDDCADALHMTFDPCLNQPTCGGIKISGPPGAGNPSKWRTCNSATTFNTPYKEKTLPNGTFVEFKRPGDARCNNLQGQ